MKDGEASGVKGSEDSSEGRSGYERMRDESSDNQKNVCMSVVHTLLDLCKTPQDAGLFCHIFPTQVIDTKVLSF